MEHDFKIILHYHSYSNIYIHPFGDGTVPDEPILTTFREIGNEMAEYNGYAVGTGLATIGYTVNGDAVDWTFGDQNIINKKFEVLDARSKGRFEGRDPEPRKELRSGSIPNSICLPYKECINNDNSFKKINELKYTFEKILGPKLPANVVFSCGSGVTASVLALAYSLINNKYLPRVYDGSWAEYGRIKK